MALLGAGRTLGGQDVAGFGAGAFIFNQVQTHYVNPANLKRTVYPYNNSAGGYNTEEAYFAASDVSKVPDMFLLLAAIYGAMQLLASLFMANPPAPTAASINYQSQEQERRPLLPAQDAVEEAGGRSGELAGSIVVTPRGMVQTTQ